MKEQSHANILLDLKEDHAAETSQLQERLALTRKLVAKNVIRLCDKQREVKDLKRECSKIEVSLKILSAELKVANEQKSNMEAEQAELFAECDRIKTVYFHNLQSLRQALNTANTNFNEAMQIGDNLRASLDDVNDANTALKRQMGQAVTQIGALQLRIEAVETDRAIKFIRDPPEYQCAFHLRPNQLHDAEQALLMSQHNHEIQQQRNIHLSREVTVLEASLSGVVEERDTLRDNVADLRKAYELATDTQNAHYNIARLVAQVNNTVAKEDPELEDAIHRTLQQDAAFAKELVEDKSQINLLQNEIRRLKTTHRNEIKASAQQVQEHLSRSSELDGTKLQLELSVDALRAEVIAAEEQLTEAVNAATSYRQQCENRAFGSDVSVLYRHKDAQIQQLQGQLDTKNIMLVQQHEAIRFTEHGLSMLHGWAQGELEAARRYRNERDFSEAKNAALEAWFKDNLQHEPLRVDSQGYMTALTPEEEAVFSSIDNVLYQITGGTSARKQKDPEQLPESKYEKMRAAVMVEEKKRKESEARQLALDYEDANYDDSWLTAQPSTPLHDMESVGSPKSSIVTVNRG